MKECCENKKIENCGYCIEYPCNKIEKAFKKTKEYKEKSKKILSNEDYELFKKAFYMKGKNLNKIKLEREK